MVRVIQAKKELFLCVVNGYQVVPREEHFDAPGDHADELETSLLMHLTPDTVLPLSEAGTGHSKKFRVSGLNEGWAWTPRQWTQVTADTGVGNPTAATAEKGKRYFCAITEKTADFLVELAAADPANMYV